MSGTPDILVGIDAGTSVIKAIVFDMTGHQLDAAATPNRYTTSADGAATQPLDQTWADCTAVLNALCEKVPDLARRTAAIAVTAQGDGTWLIDRDNRPVTDGWLWLDARSAPVVERMRGTDEDRDRFARTGSGLNSCQMGSQLAYMKGITPEWVSGAATAFHCKDWLYLNLTGMRVSDPSESCFTFGDFRTRAYDEAVIDSLGLSAERHLLPDIVDGSEITHPLTEAAAKATGFLPGTPVSLGYVDVVCTAVGGGIYTPGTPAGCTVIGSTGMHMRTTTPDDVYLNDDLTGYTMVMPIPGIVAQMQSNMASTLNIDWLLNVAAGLMVELGQPVAAKDLIPRIDGWLAASAPGAVLYHPYISEAGERGPFVDNAARASFIGLGSSHRFADLARAVVEGLGMAARDCYTAMGGAPAEVRLSGGAARSDALRHIMSAAIDAPVRTSTRAEAGAAGAAMMAAVAIGAYRSMDDCIADWVTPHLGDLEAPDPDLAQAYARTYEPYRDARIALAPIWRAMMEARA